MVVRMRVKKITFDRSHPAALLEAALFELRLRHNVDAISCKRPISVHKDGIVLMNASINGVSKGKGEKMMRAALMNVKEFRENWVLA